MSFIVRARWRRKGCSGCCARWVGRRGVHDDLPVCGVQRSLARSLATEVPAAAGERRSAGDGAHGPRLFDWVTDRAPAVLPDRRDRQVRNHGLADLRRT